MQGKGLKERYRLSKKYIRGYTGDTLPLSHRVLEHTERREGVLVSWRERGDPYSSIGYQNTLRGEGVF
ncbi:hypothetical protein TSAR_011898 [Trichomalopsis sarcophagae]|uniref:Uncharacterized protein n=1 Tax=Trichomalopsis sarcophagae TaxID=543379 RepID=A0A232EK87_9HYME|nr:hypothetical protein TSAR_011898 [Trichomalopsis sarcophagae]